MKTAFSLLYLISALTALANIEYREDKNSHPTMARVNRARSCFLEAQTLGCGHPQENLDHFKACMERNGDSLSVGCQAMFKRLYGKRN